MINFLLRRWKKSRLPDGPDFLCVGAHKAGTQWLFDQLDWHPDFWMPPLKELHYFDGGKKAWRKSKALHVAAIENLDDVNSIRARRNKRKLDRCDLSFLENFLRLSPEHVDIDAYANLFSCSQSAICGDITPGYSTLDSAIIKQISKRFPALKVVFIARDPVERLWSALSMRARLGRGPLPDNQSIITAELAKRHNQLRTYQTKVVARWRQYIPDSQFGLFFFDDLVADPAELRGRILEFLGGDPNKASGSLPPGFNRKRKQSRKSPLPDDLRSFIAGLLADELKSSAMEFGGRAASWPAKYRL